ncbi:MAG: hypothetical protein AAGA58_11495 [Verrucomicrobiota bacterium]
MEHKRVIFVVGAGASSEVGLPLGNQLKGIIANHLKNERSSEINSALLREAHKSSDSSFQNKAYAASQKIAKAMAQAPSIDNFVNAHADDAYVKLCAKLAIVTTILRAERESTLWCETFPQKDQINYRRIKDTWFARFFDLITSDCRHQDLEPRLSSIAMIIFNYDRCVEHYLHLAFQNYYTISESDAAELVSKIEIYHPYGSCGSLDFQDNTNGIGFGEHVTSEELANASEGIRTFTEGTDSSKSNIEALRECIGLGEKMVFLGFAFHDINLKLLSAKRSGSGGVITILGSALGLSDRDIELLGEELPQNFDTISQKVTLRRLRSGDLLSEYARDIARSLSH